MILVCYEVYIPPKKRILDFESYVYRARIRCLAGVTYEPRNSMKEQPIFRSLF